MAFIPLPYGIKLEFSFNKDGQVCVNVFWCTKSSPVAVTSTDLDNALAAMRTWWSNYRSNVTTSTILTGLLATDWSVEDGIQSTDLAPPTPGGLLGGANVANNVTMALSFVTGRRGRSRRGRAYLVGLGAADFASANVLNVSAASDIANAYQAYKTALNGYNLVPVVASFETAGAARTVGQATAITKVGFTDGFVDSMRRRLPGRGA